MTARQSGVADGGANARSASFVYTNYQQAPPFCGFLPGIAGLHGVPLWAFYVNRGQAVVSFGVGSKDGSIARYHSAVDAYRAVSEEGFRTFLKILPGAGDAGGGDGGYGDDRGGDRGTGSDAGDAGERGGRGRPVRYEPFQPETEGVETELITSADSIVIRETNRELKVEITVRYTTLPEEPVAALLREVRVRNIGTKPIRAEILDGLPRVIPSGIGHGVVTGIPTTAVAWMEAERRPSGLGLFRARASVADTTDVSSVRSAHFAAGYVRSGGRLDGAGSRNRTSAGAPAGKSGTAGDSAGTAQAAAVEPAGHTSRMELIVDPDLLFPRGTRLLHPTRFYTQPLESLLASVSGDRADAAGVASGVDPVAAGAASGVDTGAAGAASDDHAGGERQQVGGAFAPVRADGKFPCALFATGNSIPPGESVVLHEVFGHAASESLAEHAEHLSAHPEFFSTAFARTGEIVSGICERADTRSGLPLFDGYCRQSFLDNVLRGGFPHVEETDEDSVVVPVFGRKHGDLERDYNWFVVPDEPYSQGPGNFRDVCQNRRLDVVHEPRVGHNTVREFFSLIQADGYNPLVVHAPAFNLPESRRRSVRRRLTGHPEIDEIVRRPFRPAELHAALARGKDALPCSLDESVRSILAGSVPVPRAEHGEGFWIDHWTYTVDLLDSYLAIYPDREFELYFGDSDYPYFDNAHIVLPRTRKWRVDARGLRQHSAVVRDPEKASHLEQRVSDAHWMHDPTGAVYRTTLFEKLVCLATVKFITRDPLGIGLEMEADRPGWCDALNGLPGLLGSSLSEIWDLIRLLRRIDEAAAIAQEISLTVAEEVAELFRCAGEFAGAGGGGTGGGDSAGGDTAGGDSGRWATGGGGTGARREPGTSDDGDQPSGAAQRTPAASDDELQRRWHRMSDLREEYRRKTMLGFSGRKQTLTPEYVRQAVGAMIADLEAGLDRGRRLAGGTYPTYLIAEPVDLSGVNEALPRGKIPPELRFTLRPLPEYLEGQTKAIAGERGEPQARRIHEQVLNGPLYDRKLGMLRLNASLKDESVEIGRARSFTPGWLENESIWLHMEYKYLLSLLKAGLYREFWSLARSALVPFLNPEAYGRSTYENCSFLAASCHPDETVHGRGFVARLTGATAEFLQMRFLCLAGLQPFRNTERGIELRFDPVLPREMFDERGTLQFRFLTETTVVYRIEESDDLFPDGDIVPARYRIDTRDGDRHDVCAEVLPPPWAEEVRSGGVKKLEVYFARR